ncbi:hypothetical protein BCR37DRAFT_385825 [Protomyces lactucae-debilis]|uniref:Uncharacterized protein n=1 Tax=Protomyces lactucae-debilis TaxID=2754530 RepID=A0A1Y2FQX2_PROLT|nr:uncharacterized protein BCR37DRAFT_385825 [Protomyces lactucae-debilis]ORY86383.1 hypothetical protein BCR37DRAFT_385825 [Protomyces lactucae-debilis]
MGSSFSRNWMRRTTHLVSMWLIPVMMSMEEVTSLGMCNSVFFELKFITYINPYSIPTGETAESFCNTLCNQATQMPWAHGMSRDVCHRHGPLCLMPSSAVAGDLDYPKNQDTHSDMYYHLDTVTSYGLGVGGASTSTSVFDFPLFRKGHNDKAKVGIYQVPKVYTCDCSIKAHYPKISRGPLAATHLGIEGGSYQSADCHPEAVARRHVSGRWQLDSFGSSSGPIEGVEKDCNEELKVGRLTYTDEGYCTKLTYPVTRSFNHYLPQMLDLHGQLPFAYM